MVAAKKTECPPDMGGKIQRIEDRSDKCYRDMALMKMPWNVAAWTALTDSIRQIEVSVPTQLYGSRHHINAAMNASMVAAQIYRLARQHGCEPTLDFSSLQWTPRLAAQARQAFEVAKGYLSFCTAFPYWHADKYAAELIDDSTVRFISQASPNRRRINAYQQGIRPRNSTSNDGASMETTPALRALFNRSLSVARQTSGHGVTFPGVK